MQLAARLLLSSCGRRKSDLLSLKLLNHRTVSSMVPTWILPYLLGGGILSTPGTSSFEIIVHILPQGTPQARIRLEYITEREWTQFGIFVLRKSQTWTNRNNKADIWILDIMKPVK